MAQAAENRRPVYQEYFQAPISGGDLPDIYVRSLEQQYLEVSGPVAPFVSR